MAKRPPPRSVDHYVEEVSAVFEQGGLPPMAGRILGWLLVSDPPHQTAAELAVALDASTGSISTMTRLLEEEGLVERIRLPGSRSRYYRIRRSAWTEMLHRNVEYVETVREVADRGLALLSDEDPERREALEELRDLHAYVARRLPELLRGWASERRSPGHTPETE